MSESLKIVPGRPDAEIAAELKDSVVEALQPILKILDEAARSGFVVTFNLGMGPLGKNQINHISIAKQF